MRPNTSSSLNNEVSDNSNINLNGYTLYVNGKAITSTDYNGALETTNQNNNETSTSNVENERKNTINSLLDLKKALIEVER